MNIQKICLLMNYFLPLHIQNEAIHNKDYSVVKTFKAATSVVAFLFKKNIG